MKQPSNTEICVCYRVGIGHIIRDCCNKKGPVCLFKISILCCWYSGSLKLPVPPTTILAHGESDYLHGESDYLHGVLRHLICNSSYILT